MKLNKSTLKHLAKTAIENYENEVAFKQGCLTHYLYTQLRVRRWWPNPYKNVLYTNVLEWVEGMKLPYDLRWYHRKLHARALRLLYVANILDDHDSYVVAKHMLNRPLFDEYDLTDSFYNWLVFRQEV